MDNEWFRDFANVIELANWLNERRDFLDIDHCITFFAEPWAWTDEWGEMQAELAAPTK